MKFRARYWTGCVIATLAIVLASNAIRARAQNGDSEDQWIDMDGDSDLLPERSGGVRTAGPIVGTTIPDVYSVRKGDTLWDITGRFYGSPWHWPQVWSYNPEVTNPHWIYPNDRLRLQGPDGQRPQMMAGAPGGPRVAATGPRGNGAVLLRDQAFLDREALRDAGTIVGSPEEHMLLSPYDTVYIDFTDEGDAQPDQDYTIFRVIEPEERSENEEGVLVRIFGTVRLQDYLRERRVARGTVTEALDPIERGFRVAKVPRRFETVAPRRNDRSIEARVIATLRPQTLIGDQEVTFVNAGAEQGVQLGNRFFVVRHGDVWREELTTSMEEAGATVDEIGEPREYPPEIVAEGIVVNVRPQTAALFVTRALEPIVIGDQAIMHEGY